MLFSTSLIQSQSPHWAGNGSVTLHFQGSSLLTLKSEIRWRAVGVSGINIVTHPLLLPPKLHPEQVPTSFYGWENHRGTTLETVGLSDFYKKQTEDEAVTIGGKKQKMGTN